MTRLQRFMAELRRRRVIRATLAYGAIAWLIVEVSSEILPALMVPEWAHRLVVLIALAGIPVVVVLAWIFDISPKGIEHTESLEEIAGQQPTALATGAGTPQLLPPSADSAIASLCILPFEVLSSDPEDQFIAQGVCAEVSSALAKLKGVRVVSRTSTGGLEEGLGVREIGARLGVRYLLSGSLRRHQEKIRIIVELADAETGQQLWTETYHRVLDDVMEAEEEIAGAIVGAFGGEQLRAQIARANKGETSSHTAWSLVHKARAYVLNYNKATLTEAEGFAREALALDPDYAAAHAALAAVLSERVSSGLAEDPEADLAEAVKSIETALRRTPDDPFVLKLAGNVLQYAGRHDDAIEQLRRAVEISAFDLGAWGYLAGAMVTSDDPQVRAEALEILARILEMAPRHPGAAFWLHHRALAYTVDGDHEQAKESAQQSVKKLPSLAQAWYLLANAQACLQDEAGARGSLARAEQANPDLTPDEYRAFVRRTSPAPGVATARDAGLVDLGDS